LPVLRAKVRLCWFIALMTEFRMEV